MAHSPDMPLTHVVVHLDVDCFFAQVEERLDTSLKGKPMGVQQNMEVAAVNYEARAFGLFNRISVQEARRLCPHLVLVRGDNGVNGKSANQCTPSFKAPNVYTLLRSGMQRYRNASHGVLRVVMESLDCILPARSKRSWSGRPVETPSFDDVFVLFDRSMTDAWQRLGLQPGAGPCNSLHSVASAWAWHTRAAILQQERLTCSAGIASTKLLAMLATKKNKPNGHHCVKTECEATFFAETR
jgi:DNA polymerase iota